jgi:hypothetical protein
VNNFPLKSFQLDCEILAPTEKDFASDLYKKMQKGTRRKLEEDNNKPSKVLFCNFF